MPEPTPTLTPTLEPTPPPGPTSIAVPTPIPTSVATPPVDESGDKAPSRSKALSPLDVTGLQAFISEVSDAERTCLLDSIDPNVLIMLVQVPGLTAENERGALIGCLEHETLLRLFLTAVLDETGPLGPESSACIRDGFADTDLAALMMAAESGSNEDAQAAMAGVFATLSCLSEEEFQAAGPALGMGPEDREGLQCVLEALGGSGELAALMAPDAGPPVALLRAAIGCNLPLFEEPAGELMATPAPTPPAPPGRTPPPTPTPGRTPTSTPGPARTGFPWEKDGLTQEEEYALEALQGIESEHPAVSRVVLGLPWLTDSITRTETSVLTSIWGMAINDASVAERMVALPWLADSITEEEELALTKVGVITYYDVPLAHAVMDFPWWSDGVTDGEVDVIDRFRHISEQEAFDPALLERVLGFQWLADSVGTRHGNVLAFVAFMASHDKDLAQSILDTPIFDEPVGFFPYSVIVRLQRIISDGVWDHIPVQPWFQDGLSEEDYARIAAAYSLSDDEDLFLEIIEGAHIRSENDILPSGGEVKLVAISRSPLGLDIAFELMRTAVFELEEFMGVPWRADRYWPEADVGVAYAGVFVEPTFTGGRYRVVPGALVPVWTNIIYHEMAHAYFGADDFPKWVSEGTAEFFQAYIDHVSEGTSLRSRYERVVQGCPLTGISTVQQSIEYRARVFEAGRGLEEFNEDCAYTMGEAFMLGMYLSLGHDVASSHLRGLYRAGVANPERLTEAEVYHVLLSNTPPEQQDQFRDLYSRLHGGPIPD